MTLETCKSIELLPHWMKEDVTDKTLCKINDDIVKEQMIRIQGLNKYGNLNNMSEEQLDQLAYERNISWYQYDANITQKREMIRLAPKIIRKLGTKWAIEQVLTIYFNESKVIEWFEYNGTPGHFKIQTIHTSTVDDDSKRFLSILNKIKKYSQVLDKIEVIASSSQEILYAITTIHSDTVISVMKE